jgi:tetratricopeptide (TPR) repeat protein
LYRANLDKNPEKAIAFLAAGRKKYPENTGMMFDEINYYLKAGKLDILTDKLKAAIAKEPNNIALYTTTGNVYENLAKEVGKTDAAKSAALETEAMGYYDQAMKLDPNNSVANYAKGAFYYNKAAIITADMKKLDSDMTKAGQAKYDVLKKNMLSMFETALPFFQKSETSDPNDQNTLVALKEIYARIDKLDVSSEMKKRLENVRAGGKNASSYFKK